MQLQILINDLIRLAIREDLSQGDPTTAGLIERDRIAKALIFARAQGIISGLNVAKAFFETIDPRVKFKILVPEGSQVKKNMVVAEIAGKARTLFKGERLALNFIQHLSGISTLTNQFVKKVKGYPIKITDTRKTTPGLRYLEKQAVKTGGGFNHRMNLGDFTLIKDNHWRFLPEDSITEGVKRIRRLRPELRIEVEVEKIRELKKVLEAKVDIIMLDNMNYSGLKKAIKLIKDWRKKRDGKKPFIEISGKVNLSNIKSLARLGVEQVSIGALTHSAPAFPVDMEILNE